MIKVKMLPHLDKLGGEVSGIATVIRAYFKYLPLFGIELVPEDATRYDLLAVHAGMTGGQCDIAHLHGLYWTADYAAPSWEYESNARIVEALRHAWRVTVPSPWVAETIQRDMHFSPDIVPHGVEWDKWQHNKPCEGHIIGYAKNRAKLDVCDPDFLTVVARRFPDEVFLTTYPPSELNLPDNIDVTGLMSGQEMMDKVQTSACYISTTKETFALGVLEAMAAGVPVLSARHGNAANLVQHGKSGYLYKPGDIDDLCRGLEYCLDNREVLGGNGRELARVYTWEAACRQVASIYGDALAEKRKRKTVGVVIPVYNKKVGELERAILSACNQSQQPDTIIVVDDGSEADKAADYQRLIASGLPESHRGKVRYVRQANKGVAWARNHGIALAGTTYITCLDSDDTIEPTFIELCVSKLDRDRSLGVVYTGLRYIKPDGKTGLSPWPGAWDYDRHVAKANQVPTCCMFRTEMWKRLGGYRQRYAPNGAGAEDGEFFLRAGAYGWRGMKVTEEPLFVYSWMSGQVTGDPNYKEVDWLAWHPWTKDGRHPFASYATPKDKSHPVRQYDEPIISVVIPVGSPQHAELLINALDSLEAQTFRKWEAVVVDDTGSLDGYDRLNSVLEGYPYVRRVDAPRSGEQIGAGAARNLGASVARSPFLLFLDADDHLHPDCMQEMLDHWSETGAMVYSDYMGLATVADPAKLSPDLQQNLVAYHPKKQEALIRYQAADYDCAKAALQPENPPFIWNNVTTLMPTSWFRKIGGFDEGMKSWEDVDLWYRLAWAGRCFSRIKKPLMVYRFHTGQRREVGLADWDNLLAHMNQKKKGVTPMPCNCNNNNNPNQAQADYVNSSQRAANNLPDDELVMIEYMHPNRGSHAVYGGGSPRRSYGYRKQGERFLVQRADLKLYPQWFRPITVAEPPAEKPALPPPPVPLFEMPARPETIVTTGVVEEGNQPFVAAKTPTGKHEQIIQKARLDLQALPGVTPAVANAMRRAGVRTAEDILRIGVEGLLAIQWIGPAKAPIIFNYVQERYGNSTSPVDSIPGDVAIGEDVVQPG